jgi:hypothetical protein
MVAKRLAAKREFDAALTGRKLKPVDAPKGG